jgi:hypothetical protein
MRHGLAQSSIRLNRRPVRLLTKLKTGDVLVAVPRSIVGGNAGRYDHLDLARYRRTMTPDDFKFFTNFVGADRLGLFCHGRLGLRPSSAARKSGPHDRQVLKG